MNWRAVFGFLTGMSVLFAWSFGMAWLSSIYPKTAIAICLGCVVGMALVLGWLTRR